MSILSIFRRPAATADALRVKISELQEMQPALAAAARDAAAKRAKGLLNASDAELAKLEAALAAAERELDRCNAAIAQLDHDLHELDEADALAAITAVREAAERRAATFSSDFLARYDQLAGPLAVLMREYAEIEAAVAAANAECLDFHRQRGPLAGAPAPVRNVTDRISEGRSIFSAHLATRLASGTSQPGFGNQ